MTQQAHTFLLRDRAVRNIRNLRPNLLERHSKRLAVFVLALRIRITNHRSIISSLRGNVLSSSLELRFLFQQRLQDDRKVHCLAFFHAFQLELIRERRLEDDGVETLSLDLGYPFLQLG